MEVQEQNWESEKKEQSDVNWHTLCHSILHSQRRNGDETKVQKRTWLCICEKKQETIKTIKRGDKREV